jgi:TRAP-type C4-dicarboxylate transport system substrate-binding protein
MTTHRRSENGLRLNRRSVLTAALAGIAAPALVRPGLAQAPEVTLRMHHFLSPLSNGHARFLKPWADQVMARSAGRIRIDIFPSMQLGGAPPQLFDQARDGVVDLVWTLPGNTPGRFPGIETFELPFVAHKRAVVNSRAIAEFAGQHLAEEFREVHPVCIWAHDHGLIHASRAVRTMEDLRGLRLRFPTRLAGEALKALGAGAIGMPVPQVPEALTQRVIDGAVLPWEVVPAIKVQEMVRFHTEIPGSPTLYTASFVLAMNKARYESLPADLRGVIDALSGPVAATMAGEAWDSQAIAVEKMVRERGNAIHVLDDSEAARWREATQGVRDQWVAQMQSRGRDGAALLAAARSLIAKHSA